MIGAIFRSVFNENNSDIYPARVLRACEKLAGAKYRTTNPYAFANSRKFRQSLTENTEKGNNVLILLCDLWVLRVL
jgi:hypothetical protein